MSDAQSAGGPLYALPSAAPVQLRLRPRKTSWDRGTASSQNALGDYLDHVQEVAAPMLASSSGDLALHLDVGLAPEVDPLHEHDLDNFLHPIVARLGGYRFVTAWATKAPGGPSFLRIEPARRCGHDESWHAWPGRTTASTSREREWKDQVKAALAHAGELPPGPVGIQISMTVSPQRSWPNLCKMIIDGLDPILGRSFPDDEYDPKDGRVVRLGIHVREDSAVGWDVPFVIRARPASLDWPEMAWFAAMNPADRASWLAEHQRRCTPNRRSRRGARARLGGSVHAPGGTAPATSSLRNASSGRSTVSGVDEIRELTAIEAFTAAVAADQPLVITDNAKPAKLHPAPRACSGVTEDYFVGKVITRGGRTGKYFAVASEAAALKRWPKMTICANCG